MKIATETNSSSLPSILSQNDHIGLPFSQSHQNLVISLWLLFHEANLLMWFHWQRWTA
jgi:hypothetical protein